MLEKYASLAAATTFKTDLIPTMALNVLQGLTFTYNPATRSTVSIFDKMIKNKVGKSRC